MYSIDELKKLKKSDLIETILRKDREIKRKSQKIDENHEKIAKMAKIIDDLVYERDLWWKFYRRTPKVIRNFFERLRRNWD